MKPKKAIMITAIISLMSILILGTTAFALPWRTQRNVSAVLEYTVYRYTVLQQIATGITELRRVVTLTALHGGEYAEILGLSQVELEEKLDIAARDLTWLIESYRCNISRDPQLPRAAREASKYDITRLEKLIQQYVTEVAEYVLDYAFDQNRTGAVTRIADGASIMDEITELHDWIIIMYVVFMDDVVHIIRRM